MCSDIILHLIYELFGSLLYIWVVSGFKRKYNTLSFCLFFFSFCYFLLLMSTGEAKTSLYLLPVAQIYTINNYFTSMLKILNNILICHYGKKAQLLLDFNHEFYIKIYLCLFLTWIL